MENDLVEHSDDGLVDEMVDLKESQLVEHLVDDLEQLKVE